MQAPFRKPPSIIVLLVLLLSGMSPLGVQAGNPPSMHPTAAGASSVLFGWAKAMGGTSYEVGNAIGVDGSGSVYIAGSFNDIVDFDPGSGIFNLASVGFSDIFVSKLDSAGNFLWAKRMGAAGYDFGLAMTVDANGNVYTTGYFNGVVDFDPGEGVYELSSAGWSDIFVSKLDRNGNFLWAKSMGGGSDDVAAAIAVDASGNVYTTGFFRETGDFDPGPGIVNLTSAGGYDIFVSGLDSNGGMLWAKAMGGTSDDYGKAVAVDMSGNVHTSGYFFGTADFDPGPDVSYLTSAGASDIFVSKLDSGGSFLWVKGLGGLSDDIGNGITLDASGNVYTTGSFLDTVDFDPGESVYDLTSAGGPDIFVSKLDNAGNFAWARSMGGGDNEFGYAITLDSSGNVYTTGYFLNKADFDPGDNLNELESAGDADVFVSKLDSSGNYLWAKGMGGIGNDYGNAIAVGASGNVYTTGSFIDTSDFDPGAGIFNLSSAGEEDIFISKLLHPLTATLRSTGAQDGWVLESSETSNQGSILNNAASSLYLGDNAQKKQYRSVLSFNTQRLPDDAVITKVVLRVKKQGIAGSGNPIILFQGFMLDIRKGYFGTAPRLQASDFQSKANKSYGPYKPALKDGWYTFNLTVAKAYVNRLATGGGVTQVRLRFKLDDNNNAVANILKLYSGNAAYASRPELFIEYYVP